MGDRNVANTNIVPSSYISKFFLFLFLSQFFLRMSCLLPDVIVNGFNSIFFLLLCLPMSVPSNICTNTYFFFIVCLFVLFKSDFQSQM